MCDLCGRSMADAIGLYVLGSSKTIGAASLRSTETA